MKDINSKSAVPSCQFQRSAHPGRQRCGQLLRLREAGRPLPAEAQASCGPAGLWQELHRSHADRRVVRREGMGRPADQAPRGLSPASWFQGSRRGSSTKETWKISLASLAAS